MMYYIEQTVTSFIASAAFGMIFNAPRKALWQCGLAGMVGWVLYIWLQDIGIQKLAATVVAAYCVTMISYFFAKNTGNRSSFSACRALFRSFPADWRMTRCGARSKTDTTRRCSRERLHL